MTTNATTSARTAARFYAAATTNGHGRFEVIDRTDPRILVAIKGRAEARRVAAVLNSHAELIAEPQPQPVKAEADAKPRTSHADCAHASSKLARAICRRDRDAARIVGDQVEASTPKANV